MAPAADVVDVDEIAAEAEEFGDGEGVAGVRLGGDLAERGAVQGGDLGGGGGVLEEEDGVGSRSGDLSGNQLIPTRFECDLALQSAGIAH
ncbi:hypothetical protein [Nonomuraea montanisoli]|uniref:hypothetical protein n=1 Tax=Nonomuraea montanisoli TaxID=2741721 RepID=UPI001F1F909E|nr:hypothetical protein [Nonomuraea montanisoli]